jgi:hypothetical protein
MRTKRVMRHQLLGDLLRQRRRQAATDVDGRQFAMLSRWVLLKLMAFTREVGPLGVGLRMDRHVFAGGHRHGACHQTGDAGHQDAAVARARGRDTHHQTCDGNDPVIGAKHRRAQPADAVAAVVFAVAARHRVMLTRRSRRWRFASSRSAPASPARSEWMRPVAGPAAPNGTYAAASALASANTDRALARIFHATP